MNSGDIEHLAKLCRSLAGLDVGTDHPYLLESRLSPLARREGFGTVADLMTAVRADHDDRLIWAAIEAMTVSQTIFFRDRRAFEILRSSVLPAIGRRGQGRPIRIWSAGCATGAEAFSLAMSALDIGLSADWPLEIIGSDIGEQALEKARSGLFTQFEVQRGLPIRHLLAYFTKQDEMWSPTARLRSMIRWRRDNLIGDLEGVGHFDLILCRHVLPMMTLEGRRAVIQSLMTRLAPGGFLMLGPGEIEGPLGSLQPIAGAPELYSRDPAFRLAA